MERKGAKQQGSMAAWQHGSGGRPWCHSGGFLLPRMSSRTFQDAFFTIIATAVVQCRLPAAPLRRSAMCCERQNLAHISLSQSNLLVLALLQYPEREITVRISLSRREGDGFRGRSDGGLPKFGTSPSKEAVFDGDRSFRGTSPSLGAMETLSTAPLRRSAMCCPPLRSFVVRRLSAVPLRRGAALPSSVVRGYFPARCFSQAQAAARVSSTLRSAFQPISRFARDGSAQMAVTSPARRGAKR